MSNCISIIKKIKTSVLIMVFIQACGGAGTQVVNPTNPSEIIQKTDENECYKITVNLLPAWEIEFYGPGVNLSSLSFTDPMPNEPTAVVALLTRGERPDPLQVAKGDPIELTRFTFFYSVLENLSFESFVESKVPAEFVEYIDGEPGVQGAVFVAKSPGNHLLLAVFTAVSAPGQSYIEVLWYLAEILGEGETPEAQIEDAVLLHDTEFRQIFESVEFEPKPCLALDS